MKPQVSTPPDQHVHSAPSYQASESFGSSTWASGDSFWNPYLSSTAAADKEKNEKPASSLRENTKATSSQTVKKLPTPITPSGRVEHPKRESTPAGLKSPIMSSTPVSEPATKSAPVEKLDESTSAKPVLQDKQTAKPGEPSARRAKQHKTTGRSQGDSGTKSKGMMKLKKKSPSSSSVTSGESPVSSVRTQDGSETNASLRTDTDDSHAGVDVPDSSATGRDAAGGDESTLSLREAGNGCVPSRAEVPVADDSSVARKSSETGPEKFSNTLEEEPSRKELSGEKDGIQSGSGSGGLLNYVTQALLPKHEDRVQEVDPNSEGERSGSGSLNKEYCMEGTSKRSDFTSTPGAEGESQEQTINFSDVQLQVFQVAPQSGGGSAATGEGEVESGVQRPKVEVDDQLLKEIEDKPEREHVASPEPDHTTDTVSVWQDRLEQTGQSGTSQNSSSPSPDTLEVTGSAATHAETHLPVSTRIENSLEACVSHSPTTESQMETTPPTGLATIRDEKTSLPQHPSSNLEGSAAPVTVKAEEEGGKGTEKEGGGDQPLGTQGEIERLRKVSKYVGSFVGLFVLPMPFES